MILRSAPRRALFRPALLSATPYGWTAPRPSLTHPTHPQICTLTTDRSNEALASYIKESVHKDPESTVYRGTLFEMQTLAALESIGIELSHVGGKNDRGVDLRGHWPLSHVRSEFDPYVIVQCKGLQKGCTPDHIRALIGTVVSMPSTYATIGILSTFGHRHFTKELIGHFSSTHVPLGLAMVTEASLKSIVFNAAAQDILEDVVVTTRFDKTGKGVPIVTYKGEVVSMNKKKPKGRK